MADIYRYEWQDPVDANTKWRWEFSPAGNSYTPTIENLPDDVIDRSGCDFNWQLDSLPLGLARPMQSKMLFRWKRMTTAQQDMFCNTRQTFNLNINTTGLYFITFEVGATLRVWSSTDSGTTWSLCFLGVQDLDATVRPNLEKGTMEVKFVDVFQYSTKLLSFTALRSALWNELESGSFTAERCGVNEFVWTGNDGWMYVVNTSVAEKFKGVYSFMFCDLTTLGNKIAGFINKIASAIMRETVAFGFSFSHLGQGLYKQTYDTTPTVGTALATADVYVIVFGMDDDNPANWSLKFSFTDELSQSYGSVWDWYVDTWSQAYAQSAIRYYGNYGATMSMAVFSYAPMGELLNAFDTGVPVPITTSAGVRGVSASLFDRRLRVANVSTEFAIDKDVDSVHSSAKSSRNDFTMNATVVYNNSPVAGSYGISKSREYDAGSRRIERMFFDDLSLIDFGHVDYGTNVRVLGLYYFDSPTHGTHGDAYDYTVYASGVAIRVHSWKAFLNDGETATPPASFPVTLPADRGSIGARAIAIAVQQSEGWLRLLADKIVATFSDQNSATCKVTLPWNALKTTWAGDDIFAIFYANTCNVELDLTQYVGSDTIFNSAPTVWYVVDSQYKPETGLAEFELWGKT